MRHLYSTRIGSILVPMSLVSGISNALKGFPRDVLWGAAQAMSGMLRTRMRHKGKSHPRYGLKEAPSLVYDEEEAKSYIAHRLPGIYGTNLRIFSDLQKNVNLTSFSPVSMLDYGSGPATSVLAAKSVFPSLSLNEVVCIEPSEEMQKLAKKIFKAMYGDDSTDSFVLPVEFARVLHRDPNSAQLARPFDLAVASYSLSETALDADRHEIVHTLFSALKPGGLLMIVEAGTPVGFDVIKSAREYLLGKFSKAQVVAPCTHSLTCPMDTRESWCHFSQRVQRTSLQMAAKKGSQPYEDEKYSFVVLQKHGKFGNVNVKQSAEEKEKEERVNGLGRVLLAPRKRGKHVLVRMCTDKGEIETHIVSKRKSGKERYKEARKMKWGDAFLRKQEEHRPGVAFALKGGARFEKGAGAKKALVKQKDKDIKTLKHIV